MVRDVRAKFPNGYYVVLYDGDGTLDFAFDAKVLRRSAGRIEIFANYTTWLNNGNYQGFLGLFSDKIKRIF